MARHARAPEHEHTSTAACGGGTAHGAEHDAAGRRAVDPDARTRNLERLRRVEGQVRGLQRMVEEDRYRAGVTTQISSAHEALRGTPEEARARYDELVDLMYRHSR